MGLWSRLWAAGYDFLGARTQRVEAPYRKRIAEAAPGEVLEIGAGTGFNFPHYRAATKVFAIEPDPSMRRRGERRALAASVAVAVLPGSAHALPFADASFDTVILSLVLCSIPDADLALREARRVLRPRGRIHFYEHVRATDPALARKQDRINPIWRFVNRGCNTNRDSVGAIERAGFRFDELERFDLAEKGVPKVVRPHAIGVASRD
jgi:ubiquinone/menaquinone biosynthesis C-methylase UbiE